VTGSKPSQRGLCLNHETPTTNHMTLDEQIQAMVAQGAALMHLESGIIFLLGIVIVDDAGKQLFFMEQWATGTGGGHVLSWETTEQQSNQVLFLVAGKLSFGIAPFIVLGCISALFFEKPHSRT
jgi:hypothetical protein